MAVPGIEFWKNKKSLDLAGLPKTHEMYVYLQFLGSKLSVRIDYSLLAQPLSLVVLPSSVQLIGK